MSLPSFVKVVSLGVRDGRVELLALQSAEQLLLMVRRMDSKGVLR